MKKVLSHTIDLAIKFSDIDSMGIVWHGHYVRYFEEGREAFGREYHIGYTDFSNNNIAVPVVKISCDYKRMIRYEDNVQLITTLVDNPAAKLIYEYELVDAETRKTIAVGTSTQVFLQKDNYEMMLTLPEFVRDWKEKWLEGNKQ